MWVQEVVPWILYGGGGFIALVSLLQILFPQVFWRYTRWMARSAGVTTDNEPASGAFSAIRLRASFRLVGSLVFLMVVYFMLQQSSPGFK